jgi:zinc transport system permease protein
MVQWWQYGFIWESILILSVIAAIFGLLSPFVVSKKAAFLGEAISHSTFLGLSIASCFLQLDQQLGIFGVSLTVTACCALILVSKTKEQNQITDSYFGVYLVVTMGLGAIIHQNYGNPQIDLLSLLFGDILLLSRTDTFLVMIAAVILILIYQKYKKAWTILAIPPHHSHFLLKDKTKSEAAFIFALTLSILVAVKVTGTLIANSLLIMPGIAALKLATNMRRLAIISVLFSVSTALSGLILSFAISSPVGPTLAVFQFICLLAFGKMIKKQI